MTYFKAFLENLRPRQWSKNLILFAGVIFAQKFGETTCLIRATIGALIFCLASGAVYVYNDIADRDLDRRHPYKCLRPIASGRLPVPVATRLLLGLLTVCLVAAGFVGLRFLAAVALFFVWNWLYTRVLKQVMVLDVFGIALSFVIRAVASVYVLHPHATVEISTWLLLCTTFLSLFLGFCKRRDEFVKLTGAETRPALRGYSEAGLTALIGGSFGLTLMAYSLYTIWPSTVDRFGSRDLIYTLPFVFLGLGRYLYLVFREGRGGRPHEILLNDTFLQVIVIGWIVASVWIIGMGQ